MANRVVLDTNVYISAYGFGGKSAALMRSAIEGEFTLIISPAILTGIAVILYDILGFDDAHVRAVMQQLSHIAEIVRPEATVHVIADEADNRVLECAIEGQADVIISGDRHLLDLGSYEGIEMMRVAEFLSDAR